ncbi:MAG: exodeoxyribonuclease VII large subunit [Clostridia bacterium]|nr:exodeoxyribonuclease VII large subunit [Clostridia bacterium]
MYGYEQEFRENIYSVSQLNGFVKELIESVPVFSGIRVRGEISNFVRHRSGHLYFSLKDGDSVVKAVMFVRDAKGVRFPISDGMKVVAKGRLTVYPPSGVYQLVVSSLEADGKGALYEAYEKLKSKLEAEGLFDSSYKKPIPKYPRTVGVITSPTGAAVRDIINVTGRRYPLAKVLIYPALVQGEGAEASLISGVRYFTKTDKADVVIIGRGGGSIEDLWAFNSEALAREIAGSHVPFISAVGHETDFTICDFASSLRAPTPSGAAELAVPDIKAVRESFITYLSVMERDIRRITDGKRQRLESLAERKVLRSPYGFIDEKRLRLDRYEDKLVGINKIKLGACRSKYERLVSSLEALSPLSVLTRGYGAVYSDSGAVITTVDNVKKGDRLTVRLKDGTVTANAEAVRRENNKNGKEN